MIPDQEIVLYRAAWEVFAWSTDDRDRRLAQHLHRLLDERELLVKEHRAMLPLVHGDIEQGAIDSLFEAWGQVEAFK